ncbi:MAG: hypothetical protein OEY52_01030 [Gammaproteobacteria bacterium]|nr:hypothetical protein [Gammaproteobacteria bacterium]
MKICSQCLFNILFLVVPFGVCTAADVTPASTIKTIEFYYQGTGSNILIKLNTTDPKCQSGYWLSNDDPEYFKLMGEINSAYVNKTYVVLDGDRKIVRTDLGEKYCSLSGIKRLIPT